MKISYLHESAFAPGSDLVPPEEMGHQAPCHGGEIEYDERPMPFRVASTAECEVLTDMRSYDSLKASFNLLGIGDDWRRRLQRECNDWCDEDLASHVWKVGREPAIFHRDVLEPGTDEVFFVTFSSPKMGIEVPVDTSPPTGVIGHVGCVVAVEEGSPAGGASSVTPVARRGPCA